MAFLVNSNVIITNSRDLVGVNTAGIDGALYVGSDIQADAGVGIITAISFVGSGANLTDISADTLNPASDFVVNGLQAGIITATTSLEATGAGVGLTVTNNAYIGGNLEVNGTITGDGSGLTGVTIDAADDLIQTGNIQAGIITATTSLEATAGTGVGLTVTSDAWISGNLTVVGDVEANDVNTTSDVTKKTNISVIEGALDKVLQLRGVTFDWKSTGAHSGGIIAQDVEQVLPTLVKQGEDHKTVIYNGIVGLLVEAVKELVSEVEELRTSN